MINIINKKDCCGCTACYSICTHEAITMEEDALGFLYPRVNLNKFNDSYDKSLNLPKPIAYGARHKDISEVMKSRSGAVFVAISDYILDNEGVVYGAGYTDHFRVVHKRATTKRARDEFRGSKYVQSDMDGVFRQVKKDLMDGLVVLFCGTPCQTAGLNSYIGRKQRENLFLLDIVCHGVPAPFFLRDYVAWQEQRNASKLVDVNFRDKKRFGWWKHYETLTFENGKTISSYAYTFSFHTNINLRQCCSNCHYTNLKRPSDITIADFWGWQNTGITINKDNKGLSLVLCNTEKGLKLYKSIEEMLWSNPVEVKNCLQPNLQHPTSLNESWKSFEDDYIDKGFDFVMHKYFQKGIDEKPQKTLGRIAKLIQSIRSRLK